MHARDRIVRERFTAQACPSCSRHYNASDVFVLARRQPAWVVLARCEHCGHRAIYMVSFPARPLAGRDAEGDSDRELELSGPDERAHIPIDRAAVTGPLADEAISTEDVAAMRNFLGGFDGDFKTLFANL